MSSWCLKLWIHLSWYQSQTWKCRHGTMRCSPGIQRDCHAWLLSFLLELFRYSACSLLCPSSPWINGDWWKSSWRYECPWYQTHEWQWPFGYGLFSSWIWWWWRFWWRRLLSFLTIVYFLCLFFYEAFFYLCFKQRTFLIYKKRAPGSGCHQNPKL